MGIFDVERCQFLLSASLPVSGQAKSLAAKTYSAGPDGTACAPADAHPQQLPSIWSLERPPVTTIASFLRVLWILLPLHAGESSSSALQQAQGLVVP